MTKKAGIKAQTPLQFSPRAWWQIIKRVRQKIKDDNLSLIAAGVAFYFLLAIFPLLAAMISLYGFLVEPQQLIGHLQHLLSFFPEQSRYILQEQIEKIVNTSNTQLSVSFISSLALAVYGGGKGAQALITACNITYQEQSTRGILFTLFLRFVLTLLAIMLVIATLFLITLLPIVFHNLSGFELDQRQAQWLTLPILLLIFNLGLSSLYRFGPDRETAKWRWVTTGSLFASLGWIAASAGFSYYLAQFAHYNETYGSLGAVVVLLMWFYLTAFVILLGAELNSSIELQTHEDSTTGSPKPIGKRGATVADTTTLR